MNEPKYHVNRHAMARFSMIGTWPGKQSVFGRAIEPGTTLERSDVYESTNGNWEECPCPGVTLQEGVAVIWIRPEREP